MHYRDVVDELQCMHGAILVDIEAPWILPRELAPYCGRKITSVAYFPPYFREKDRPNETVAIWLERAVKRDEAPCLKLTSRDIYRIEHRQRGWAGRAPYLYRVDIISKYGNRVKLFLTPEESRNRPEYLDVDLEAIGLSPVSAVSS